MKRLLKPLSHHVVGLAVAEDEDLSVAEEFLCSFVRVCPGGVGSVRDIGRGALLAEIDGVGLSRGAVFCYDLHTRFAREGGGLGDEDLRVGVVGEGVHYGPGDGRAWEVNGIVERARVEGGYGLAVVGEAAKGSIGCKCLYIKLFPCVRGFLCLYGLCRHIEVYGAGNNAERIASTCWRCLG